MFKQNESHLLEEQKKTEMVCFFFIFWYQVMKMNGVKTKRNE